MAKDLSKLSDRDLLTALRTLNSAVTGNPAAYGLTAGDSTALDTLLDVFEGALDAWDVVNDDYDSKRANKNVARKDALTEARKQIKEIRANRNVTDGQLETAGLDLYDTVRTNSPSPTTAPIGIVEYGKLKHTIYFRDSATPDDEAKPKGMLGCEIWRYIGATPPASDGEYEFVTLDTASPYVAFYQPADAGKKVFYFLRWVSKNGDKGGWSEAVEATING